jgi:hypothetical protein
MFPVRSIAPHVTTAAGRNILPAPRMIAAKELNGESGMAPAKTIPD